MKTEHKKTFGNNCINNIVPIYIYIYIYIYISPIIFLLKFAPYLPWKEFFRKEVLPYFKRKTLCHCPTRKSCE